MANKRILTGFEMVSLTEMCSAKVQSKFPPKLKDPSYFTIPLAIGKHEVGSALCYLGASINLMSLSVFKQLNLGAPKSTTINLQLADRSLAVPEGMIEDVLAIGGALNNVRDGKLKMRVHDEEITFNMYNALNHPKHYEDLCMIHVLESKLIQQGPYVEPTGMEKKIEL
uniref:Uncharacterized protein n=1 Tax=Nicotiana tabacum TaxID=4097 RepID=A0A1S3X0I3_TOBAC|nr:PREDICTED: uncharacterized protein LOC107759810 [Nicotiana tabacum]